jgi:hypothetical protein
MILTKNMLVMYDVDDDEDNYHNMMMTKETL